jgi:NTP pyrophosphatase (non-canonical NTP hydrolase)
MMNHKKRLDSVKTVQELKDQVAAFVRERDWEQFHTPVNLATAISIEAAELMEKFLWKDAQEVEQELVDNRQEIEDELADVLIAALSFSNACSIDVSAAVEKKVKEICNKYPVEKAKGRNKKYTKL